MLRIFSVKIFVAFNDMEDINIDKESNELIDAICSSIYLGQVLDSKGKVSMKIDKSVFWKF